MKEAAQTCELLWIAWNFACWREVVFVQPMFFSQRFYAAAAGGFFKLDSLQTGPGVTGNFSIQVKPVPACTAYHLHKRACMSVCVRVRDRQTDKGWERGFFVVVVVRNDRLRRRKHYWLKQLLPGRRRTVLCNHEQETVGGYSLQKILKL